MAGAELLIGLSSVCQLKRRRINCWLCVLKTIKKNAEA